jgi:FKBP-type peptidyl-prolyl cis-trans isomerase
MVSPKTRLLPLIIGLLVVIAAVVALIVSQQPQPAKTVAMCDALPEFKPVAANTITALKTEEITVGSGVEAKAGSTLAMNYVGYLPDGTKFDSSCDRGQPFAVQIGAGQVIKGWDQGIPGMKVGGKRRLLIPSELAYGSQSPGGVIPANSPLIFDVELVAVQ